MPKTFDAEAVGLNYRLTRSTMRLMKSRIQQQGSIQVMLVREHDNPSDENAVKVVIRDAPYRGMHIGYLRRAVASVYGPALDKGKRIIREAYVTDIDPDEGTAAISIVLAKGRKSA